MEDDEGEEESGGDPDEEVEEVEVEEEEATAADSTAAASTSTVSGSNKAPHDKDVKGKLKGSATASKRSAAGDVDQPDYDYGWDVERQLAWRLRVGARKSEHHELAKEMRPPEDGLPHSPMLAVFSDGDPIPMAQVTLEKFKAGVPPPPGGKGRGRGRGGRGRGGCGGRGGGHGQSSNTDDTGNAFRGENKEGEVVQVHFRSNNRWVGDDMKKQILVSIKVGSKQLLQMDRELFVGRYKLEEKEAGEKAVEFLNTIAKPLAEGTIDRMQAIEMKNDWIREYIKEGGQVHRSMKFGSEEVTPQEEAAGAEEPNEPPEKRRRRQAAAKPAAAAAAAAVTEKPAAAAEQPAAVVEQPAEAAIESIENGNTAPVPKEPVPKAVPKAKPATVQVPIEPKARPATAQVPIEPKPTAAQAPVTPKPKPKTKSGAPNMMKPVISPPRFIEDDD